MINNKNNFLLKFLIYKNINYKVYNFLEYKNTNNFVILKETHNNVKSTFFLKNLSLLLFHKNLNFKIYFLFYISSFFFKKFYLFLNIFKKNQISYNKIYLNFFKKFNFPISSFFYNFYEYNYLFFYKNYNMLIQKNLKNSYSSLNKKVFFFKKRITHLYNYKFKNKKEFVNPVLILDSYNFFSNAKFFRGSKNNSYLNTFLFFENLIFFKKYRLIPQPSLFISGVRHCNFLIINNSSKNIYFSNKYNKIVNKLTKKFSRNIYFDNLDLFNLYLYDKIKKNKKYNFNRLHFFNNNYGNYILFLENFKKKYKFLYKFKLYSNNFFALVFFYKYLCSVKIRKVSKKTKDYKNHFFQFQKNINNTLKSIIFLNECYLNNFYLNKLDKKILTNLLVNTKQFNFVKSLPELNYNVFDSKKINKKNLNFFNNYYPIFFSNTKSVSRFFSKFRFNLNVGYVTYIHSYILSFLEVFLKKNIFLKFSNNFFKKYPYKHLLYSIHNDHKNFQPRYMKKFLIADFLEIIWYSLHLKDLTLISDWICKFMEFTTFRVHKKFLTFFNNFMNKYSKIFMEILKIRGFFFDIRGKVGVTGNSKKRHFFFKFGELNKSAKSKKMNFKQSVVRTPSGALGLTLIISY